MADASELYIEPAGAEHPNVFLIKAVVQCGPKGRQNLQVALVDVSIPENIAVKFLGRDGFTTAKLAANVLDFVAGKPWLPDAERPQTLADHSMRYICVKKIIDEPENSVHFRAEVFDTEKGAKAASAIMPHVNLDAGKSGVVLFLGLVADFRVITSFGVKMEYDAPADSPQSEYEPRGTYAARFPIT